MYQIIVHPMADKTVRIVWMLARRDLDRILLQVNYSFHVPDSEMLDMLQDDLASQKWIRRSGKRWFINLKALMDIRPPNNAAPEWCTGEVEVFPEIFRHLVQPVYRPLMHGDMGIIPHQHPTEETIITVRITEAQAMLARQTRLFLSHKGVDKKRVVEPTYRILKKLGFDPWLDKEDMPAGTKAQRGILSGFESSCAAIFFITQNFKDESFLADELDLALHEEKKRPKHFAIVPLAIKVNDDQIPKLLRTYIWKHVNTQFGILTEILSAIPVEVSDIRWKPNWRE